MSPARWGDTTPPVFTRLIAFIAELARRVKRKAGR